MNDLSPDTLFRITSAIAAGGWLLLALAVWRRHAGLRDRIAGLAVPALLSLGYSAIVLAHFAGSEGGFSTLQDVAALFRSPWMLLAGWVHYLAFDLFIGAWVARDAAERRLPRWLMVPVLPLVFLFGPAGYLAWLCLRAVHPSKKPPAGAPSLLEENPS